VYKWDGSGLENGKHVVLLGGKSTAMKQVGFLGWRAAIGCLWVMKFSCPFFKGDSQKINSLLLGNSSFYP
jgi:hypothetical protein